MLNLYQQLFLKNIIEILLTDPIFIKIGIMVSILIGLSILKKLKVAVIYSLLIGLLLYSYFVYSKKSGKEKKLIQKVDRTLKENVKAAEKKMNNSIKKLKKSRNTIIDID